MNMPEFRPARSANQAHQSLRQSIEIQDRAQHCAVLWFADIYERDLYRDLGFSSMNQYAEEALGFSRSRTRDFMQLAKKLDALPAIKDKLAAGELGYTVAREIVPVADAGNEKQWLEVAAKQSRRQLEETVRRSKIEAKRRRITNPAQGELMPAPVVEAPTAVVPVRVGFELTPTQFAQYEALLAKVGTVADKGEWLLNIIEGSLNAESELLPRGSNPPPNQIHIHECPSCAEARVASPRGEVLLSKTEREAAHCDAQVHRSGQPNRSTIPPKIRREVLTRDRNQCRRKGCRHTRRLHIHHVETRAEGGGNDVENLVTLCAGCHHLWHEKGGDLRSMLTEIPRGR